MDKNTTNALLLMLLVFVLFMWLTPKEQTPEGNVESPRTTEQAAVNMALDSLTGQDRQWLEQNIREHGTPVADRPGAVALNQNGLNLTLENGTISGTVTVEGRNIEWAAVADAGTSKRPYAR